MNRKSIATALEFGVAALLLIAFLSAEEIKRNFCSSATQWVVVLCLTGYYILFSILDWHLSPRDKGWRFNNASFWQAALVLFVLVRYAVAYQTASSSTQVAVLLTGIVFAKTISAWVRLQNNHVAWHAAWLVGLLICLFACAALWQPIMTMDSYHGVQYHGITRWGGPWDNPNLYGLLMAVGVVLTAGLLIQISTSNIQWRKTLCVALCSFAAILCGYGLFKSYSRGAWLGAVCGLAYLIAKSEIRNQKSEIAEPARFSCHSCFYRNRLPLSVIMLSVVILLFWQFRFTEWRPAQRVFSIANVHDFSWRNRVAAWEGATRMMIDRPLMGFGWGQAEAAYAKKYTPPQLDESAAIEMNDYFMLGISAGAPALICFVVYIWLNLKPKPPSPHPDPLPSPPERRGDLHTTSRAGTIVLLVGFWFDGGLFKLSVGPVFWMLMELSRPESSGARHSVRAENQLPENIGAQGTDAPYQLGKWEIWLRRAAWVLAAVALLQTTIYLGTPLLPVSNGTLAVARKCLIPPKTVADFDFLATNSIWRGKKLKVLLDHVNLANYDRELVNWQLDDKMYRDYVLSPVITAKADEQLNWRRPLWEEFYPRIRHELSPADAANIVLRQLRERVTISTAANLPHDVPEIWSRRMTDASGFEIISVAALRSESIAARLNDRGQAELIADGKWQLAPHPIAGDLLKP
jgi:hypothetical protein